MQQHGPLENLQIQIQEKENALDKEYSEKLNEYYDLSSWISQNVTSQESLHHYKSQTLNVNDLNMTMTKTISDKIQNGMKKVF